MVKAWWSVLTPVWFLGALWELLLVGGWDVAAPSQELSLQCECRPQTQTQLI